MSRSQSFGFKRRQLATEDWKKFWSNNADSFRSNKDNVQQTDVQQRSPHLIPLSNSRYLVTASCPTPPSIPSAVPSALPSWLSDNWQKPGCSINFQGLGCCDYLSVQWIGLVIIVNVFMTPCFIGILCSCFQIGNIFLIPIIY